MSRVITVEIGGHRYPIRSTLDERYVAELAAYVDRKIRIAAEAAPASDMLGIAILAALNLADEYFRARDAQSSGQQDLTERTLRLEQIVDEALAHLDPPPAPR
jgi:cell division protein ZapA